MLSLQDVQRIAHLARLELSAAEAEAMQAQMNSILAMVDQMSAVDTKGVEPMSHPQEVTQRLRDDVVTEPDRRDDFLALAPQAEDGLYLVPKVIE
ncbi:Glutamyl-tRNA(Gln) amidotransferase subunit C [Usitatibacter rugosus]|uniref:Aspartyl/glutamyl-tRNA(Asn/Gln) amidotransferase subunit C n=1 Tax=Usitatibacter rugosus TaxID=2732067 RepID=A0A6M4H0M4_9PROT|nr:Asp-tRNA(Asn)/Glu-tRNA(Gln) amidotransferase subunit GatC [Usitatibacter rugosus]QJR13056.1 Glutamyl-tRNA(Gln) amidotransferase subunit C [Usitatibacter rugosus]